MRVRCVSQASRSTVKEVARAFTLIEVLVGIAVVAALTAILLPAVGSARRAAADTASLVNLRSHAQVVTMYSGDYRDYAPFFADPHATFSVVRGGGVTITFEYFSSSEVWMYALTDQYYELGLRDGLGIFARAGPETIAYQYSPTFIARPQFWNVNTRAAGQLGPTRLPNVRSPSAKAVYLEWDIARGLPIWVREEPNRRANWGFGFVDGSARRHEASELVKPYPRGEGTGNGARFSYGIVGMHTVDGILGRDVR